MLTLKVQCRVHPTDSLPEVIEIRAETPEEVGRKFAQVLRGTMFAEWGYYKKCYYMPVEASVIYDDDDIPF